MEFLLLSCFNLNENANRFIVEDIILTDSRLFLFTVIISFLCCPIKIDKKSFLLQCIVPTTCSVNVLGSSYEALCNVLSFIFSLLTLTATASALLLETDMVRAQAM